MSSVLEELQEIHAHDPQTERISLRDKGLDDIELILEYLEMQFPNLRYLDLSQNQLTQLPMEIGRQLPKLIALDLSENKFSSISELIQVLQQCTCLRSLNISLKNATEEKILFVSLPYLCVLNGTPVSMTNKRKTHTMKSTPKEQTKPQLSEATMDLRSRFNESRKQLYPSNAVKAAASPAPVKSTSSSTSPIPSESSSIMTTITTGDNKWTSVRPTESPARISDDKTDWQKLLKHQQEQQEKRDSYYTQLKSFVSELKQSLATFHSIGTVKASSTTVSIQMLETQMDRITEKLERLPLRCSTKEEELKAQCQLLMTQSSLLQLCGQFGVDKTTQVDGKLAFAVHQLLQIHEQVLHGLQSTVIEAVSLISASTSPSEASEASSSITSSSTNGNGTPDQLKSLLEVAEQLEKELEQAKMSMDVHEDKEKKLSKENATLKRQVDMLKQQLSQNATNLLSTRFTEPISSSSSTSVVSPPPVPSSLLPARGLQRGAVLSSNVSTNNQPRYQKPTNSCRARMRVRKRQDDVSPCPSVPFSGRPAPILGPAKGPPTNRTTARVRSEQKVSGEQEKEEDVQAQMVGGIGGQVVRNLTLKQLLDLIHCILVSKDKHNVQVAQSHGTMLKETMEQHVYTYLNQRFGLQVLIVDYASAIFKGCQYFYQQDNQVAMFLHLLKNTLDEQFIQIKTSLQTSLVDLLKAFFQAKFPLKTEQALLLMVKNRLENEIYQEEWSNLVQYMYAPMDSQVLIRILQREAMKQNENQNKMSLRYSLFEKILCDYQLYGRLQLLKEFQQMFQQEDVHKIGQIKRTQFIALIKKIAPEKSRDEIQRLLTACDPFEHDLITFSDAVCVLLKDIRIYRRLQKKKQQSNKN